MTATTTLVAIMFLRLRQQVTDYQHYYVNGRPMTAPTTLVAIMFLRLRQQVTDYRLLS